MSSRKEQEHQQERGPSSETWYQTKETKMPRISIRKLFVYLLAIASCVLLALNIQQRATGLFTSSLTPSGPSGPPPPSAPALDPKELGKPKKALDGKTTPRSPYLDRQHFFKTVIHPSRPELWRSLLKKGFLSFFKESLATLCVCFEFFNAINHQQLKGDPFTSSPSA